jgi:hypothetical protein
LVAISVGIAATGQGIELFDFNDMKRESTAGTASGAVIGKNNREMAAGRPVRCRVIGIVGREESTLKTRSCPSTTSPSRTMVLSPRPISFPSVEKGMIRHSIGDDLAAIEFHEQLRWRKLKSS